MQTIRSTKEKPHSLIDPHFWTKPLSARGSVTYTSTNLSILTNPVFGKWPGGGDCAVYTATTSDPLINLYFFGTNVNVYYTNLSNGTWLNWGNTTGVEVTIRAGGDQLWAGLPYNNYSKGTTAAGPNVPTHAYKSRFTTPWGTKAYVPAGAHPDPTPDGHMAVIQPDGSVLETLGTIVMANGDLFTASASFSQPTLTADGSAMGRRATMIPNYQGIVMNGEMTAQSIPHVLILIMGPEAILNHNPVYPGYALDSGTSYTASAGSGISMGQMIAIPNTVNLNTAGLTTTAGRTVANAMQTYGGVLGDSSGPGIWGICSQTNATDIPDYSGPLASDLGIIQNLCKIVGSTDFPF